MGKLKFIFFGLIAVLLFGLFMMQPGAPAYAEPLGFTSTPVPTATPTPVPGISGTVSGLNIKKYPSQTSVERGETFSFEILVKNKTTSTEKNITVHDKVPGVYRILNVTSGKGVVSVDYAQNDIVIVIDKLLPDEEVGIQVQVQVKESAVGTEDFCNVASVESKGMKAQFTPKACVTFGSILLPATGFTKTITPEFSLFALVSSRIKPLSLGFLVLLGVILWLATWKKPQLRKIRGVAYLPLIGLLVYGFTPTRTPVISAMESEKLLSRLGQDNTQMTRLVIPFLDVDVAVKGMQFDGNSWDVGQLAQQVGWLETTSLPGSGGNTVLAGHITDELNADGPFRYLLYLQPGEKIYAYTERAVYVYQVRDQGIVSPEKNWVLSPTENPQLTLLTCAAWDDASKSYLLRRAVFADLTEISTFPIRQKAAFRTIPR